MAGVLERRQIRNMKITFILSSQSFEIPELFRDQYVEEVVGTSLPFLVDGCRSYFVSCQCIITFLDGM